MLEIHTLNKLGDKDVRYIDVQDVLAVLKPI
jgi:hypothetical protein